MTDKATQSNQDATEGNETPRAKLVYIIMVLGIILSMAGVDLVLPSVPYLPTVLGGDGVTAQYVLAAYVGGTALGLILYGNLAARLSARFVMMLSFLIFAVLSYVGSVMTSIEGLIVLRFFQGAAGSAASVLAPGIIRRLFSEKGAMNAIGLMGSIESIVPGVAPIVGAALFAHFGWQASFQLTALLVLITLAFLLLRPSLIPNHLSQHYDHNHSYLDLLKNGTYMRYALTHGLLVSGLLVYVFGAPAVMINHMGGSINDFIAMQAVGVTCFFFVSAASGNLVSRFGLERMLWLGTMLCILGTIGLYLYSQFGRNNPADLAFIFPILNIGVGIRAAPCFVSALKAARGDDARGAALTVLFILGFTAIGTWLVAPLLPLGLGALTLATLGFFLTMPFFMLALKPLD